MKGQIAPETVPIYTLEIRRKETRLATADDIIEYLKSCIEAHPAATLITVFDHYAHTASLPGGSIAADIKAAKNLVFCLGLALPEPRVLAVRPNSIGVAETRDAFIVSFMEAPMPVVNAAMEDWAEGLSEYAVD